MDLFSLEQVKNLIASGAPIELSAYGASKALDENLVKILDTLTEKYGILDLSAILFTIVKDLILNGFKANFKRIFFQENQLDIHSPTDYELGVRMYKSLILSGRGNSFEPLAREKNLYVHLKIEHNENQIKFDVRNNTTLVRGEMQKIRNSLLHAQNYNDIMEYYIERGDNSEGEGIGIALCVILLKGEGLPTDQFRIYHEDGETIAQLSIPLKKS
ncbi:hypothetical protein ND861_12615 [Leptospira sp. 2 VSF19]|uniref:Histidine kinase n=1 Tax=Leptospira soteropolitanensis TaxID=2950025 RepID=A0AAW5VN76_9LEPT|nr:hypothetical protein [Leptospira soteropolitanensis]MCW7493483.1 hypothetical protein [Leptospira soteropolitanensis]MCW7500985.1 hypothetical protein [Leptospira soteropolitanensis]MCW7523335.1 hypothetical protein [Leptospira soteropolitanensis]MCW7527196.1 hypothetical protein [Leptospira soteropolitanensis]MCW7531053.1 hypothetical protein [Leptospira soteropolitanensis]